MDDVVVLASVFADFLMVSAALTEACLFGALLGKLIARVVIEVCDADMAWRMSFHDGSLHEPVNRLLEAGRLCHHIVASLLYKFRCERQRCQSKAQYESFPTTSVRLCTTNTRVSVNCQQVLADLREEGEVQSAACISLKHVVGHAGGLR